MPDLLKEEEFIKLEKEYRFLSRAREALKTELEGLPYVVMDIETTGLYPESSEIIEIGALKTKGKEVADIFNVLIRPSLPLPPEIERMTGITSDLLLDQLSLKEILPRFLDFIKDSVLVAHHTDFDINFLKYHLQKELKIELNNFAICTLKLARGLLPNLENHKLHTVAAYFQIPLSNRHRALGDAEITYQIWVKFLDMLKDRKIYSKDGLEKFLVSIA